MRLVKFLANAGVASRRASELLIQSGRVTVDGVVVTDPARDVSDSDVVAFDGEPVRVAVDLAVYAVNKPAGVVSTASDPQHRRTVVSLVPSALRLYPVGRLDVDATGLILLTNNGELAHRLTHPSYEVDRTYRVVVARPPVGQRALRALRGGVTLEDGLTAPARVRRLAPDTIELTIHEGRNRQIKRMCEHVGHRVQRLTRVAFGPLTLGGLATGAHRRLTVAEVAALSDSAAVAPASRQP
jgi:23S rRNA pseudouridine2605 synthase